MLGVSFGGGAHGGPFRCGGEATSCCSSRILRRGVDPTFPKAERRSLRRRSWASPSAPGSGGPPRDWGGLRRPRGPCSASAWPSSLLDHDALALGLPCGVLRLVVARQRAAHRGKRARAAVRVRMARMVMTALVRAVADALDRAVGLLRRLRRDHVIFLGALGGHASGLLAHLPLASFASRS